MRYLIMHYSSPDEQAEIPPSPEFIEKMGAFVGGLNQSGVLLAGEGVGPMPNGARLVFSGGKGIVTDGPFAEAKEVIGGFLMVKVNSKQEAIDIATRYGECFGNVTIDVRNVAE